MAFNFPVMPRIFMAVRMEESFPITDILDSSLEIPDTCQWAIFLCNHDELTLEMVTDEERDYMYQFHAKDPRAKINLGIRRRLGPLLDNNSKKIELVNIILFSLSGTPVIYYGDELCMGENYYLGDRDGVRTPMQWSADRNAGFSNSNPQKLFLPVIIDPDYHYESINVENQNRNKSSPLNWMKRVIAMRRRFKAFSRGTIQFISPQNSKILAFVRQFNNEIILVAINLSRFSQFKGRIPEEIFSKNKFSVIKETPYKLTFTAYGHYWFLLKKKRKSVVSHAERILHHFKLRKSLADIFEDELKENFENDILIPYLISCRWFRGKGRIVRKINIADYMPLNKDSSDTYIIFIDIDYTTGISDTYLIPLCYTKMNRANFIMQGQPKAFICSLSIGDEEGTLYDGIYDREFHRILLELIAKKKDYRSG